PMYDSFQAKADLRPYEHVVPEVDMTATNKATAWGAKLSEGFDFTREDAADDLLLNEVIWRSVRGPDSPMPPPVRAAFVFPKGDAGCGLANRRRGLRPPILSRGAEPPPTVC